MPQDPASYGLEVKFSPPFLRPNLVRRERLLEQMAELPHIRLVLVSAPAGYGKTTLLADWRQSLIARGTAVGWLLLESQDDDPGRFFALVCHAFQTALAACPLTTGEPAAQEAARGLEVLAASTAKDLEKNLALLAGLFARAQTQGAPPCVLILDDYHTLAHPGVHHALAFLLDRMPHSVKLAIGSRADPPLPLARLRARGELVELRMADLRFTPSEGERFLRHTLQAPVEQSALALIDQRTEGWAAGLQLIGLSLRNWPDWAQQLLRPGESHRAVSSYLAEEVFHHLAPDIQHFLRNTAILDTLSAPLCDAVLGPENPGSRSAEVLAWLEQENLFVIPLDPFCQRFRYHPLFHEFLLAELQRSGPGEAPPLHYRASQWYWRNGQGDLAIQHAIQSNDLGWLVTLVEQAGFYMVARSELAALHGYLSHIPETTIQDNPVLLLIRGWEQMLQGHLELVVQDIERVEALLRDIPEDYRKDIRGYAMTRATILGNCTTLRAYIARIHADWAQGAALTELALQQLPEDDALVRSSVVFNQGQVYKERHQVERARQCFSESARLGKASGNSYIELLSLSFLGHLAVLQGQMQEAERFYRQALQVGYRADGGVAVPAVGYAETWLGEWYLIQGRLDLARQHIERSTALAELCGEYGVQYVTYLMSALLSLAEGDPAGAQAWVDKTGGIPLDAVRGSAEWIAAHQAYILLAQGRLTEAERWAESVPSIPEAELVTRPGERLALIPVRILLISAKQKPVSPGEIERGLAALAVLEQAALAGGRTLSLVEILLLKSGLCQVSGQPAKAQAALAQAHILAAPCGWTQIFKDIPVELPAPAAQLLTGREVELVRMIASGATNQEIADRLYITVGTVKSHLNHIFAKLEARHRAEAIAKARALGIF